MCKISFDDEELILFETGVLGSVFSFSLVRQCPLGEEYYQTHVDLSYKINEENKQISDTVWNETIDENIFDYIRASKSYAYCKGEKPLEIEIFGTET